MSSYLELAKILAQEVEQILNMNSDHIHSFIFWNWSLFLLWVCIKVYDGCTIPSPKLEIESKYLRRTMISVYSTVLSAYVYAYVALHIRRCLKCRAEHRQSDRHGCPIDGHWWRCICPFESPCNIKQRQTDRKWLSMDVDSCLLCWLQQK